MIIARSNAADSTELLIFGLSRENIKRLTSGQPIRLRRETHGDGIPEGWSVVIVFGETELEMKRQFEASGMISPKTKVIIDPRLE